MNRPVITLTTDFGTRDSYVGAMKGVILSRCPQANIVGISHEVEPQSISQVAYVLATAARHFPPDAIHVAVVESWSRIRSQTDSSAHPVGHLYRSRQWPYLLAVREYIQTPCVLRDGADDGGNAQQVIIEARLSDECRGVVLDDPSFWLPEVSRTFHGRDVFAPVAAYVASGVPCL